MSERTYDWNGHTHAIRRPDLPDDEVAAMVRMLMRGDLNHERICVIARDRIMALLKEKTELEQRTERQTEEIQRLRKKSAKLFKKTVRAINKPHWEDGPTAEEVSSEIRDFIENEHSIPKVMERLSNSTDKD